MKERPILFSGPMVRAILDGSKTMTRRTVKPQPQERIWPSGRVDVAVIQEGGHWYACDHEDASSHDTPYYLLKCPYGKPGDRLWVRETWQERSAQRECDRVILYRADEDECGQCLASDGVCYTPKDPWKPSIHMPRWASRITLEIVSVRVERLQDISEEDARTEGVVPSLPPMKGETRSAEESEWSFRQSFRELWDSLNAKKPGESWEDNPFVWVIEFKRIGEGQK